MRAAWRVLLSRLSRGARAPVGIEASTDALFDRPTDVEPSPPDPLHLAFDEIQAGALEVYAKAGLPILAGHYRKSPKSETWEFISDRITPEARFALALEHPAEQGWRFGRLQDLGARSTRPELQAASRLLSDIDDLRVARCGVLAEDHLLIAMELGGAWRALRDSRSKEAARLTLTPPDATASGAADPPNTKTARKPRAKGDKSPEAR